jgi:hypothetical protein
VETLLQDWHAAKRLALGPDHRSDELATFLSGAALGLWRERVAQARTTREHWQFRLKTLQVEQIEQRTASTLAVTARIDEVANFYKNRERQSGRSYDRPYRVRYLLVREQGNWRIGEMKVL